MRKNSLQRRPFPIPPVGKPVCHNPLVVHDNDDGMGDAIGKISWGVPHIEQVESPDDTGLRIGQNRIGHIPAAMEAPQGTHRIVGHRGHVVAEVVYLFDPITPGDRLDDAIGSPIKGSREQKNQPFVPGKRAETPHLTRLICRTQDRCEIVPNLWPSG